MTLEEFALIISKQMNIETALLADLDKQYKADPRSAVSKVDLLLDKAEQLGKAKAYLEVAKHLHKILESEVE